MDIFGVTAGNTKINESNLWKWVSACKSEPGTHIQRVENTAQLSTPDVEAVHYLNHAWVELKTCARPARPSTKLSIKFQPGQTAWLGKRDMLNGCAYLLIQVGSGHGAKRYAVSGFFGKEIERRVTEEQLLGMSFMILKTPVDFLTMLK